MLRKLYIKDYALIESIEISFRKGLNIITGETGAGKSILIGSLSLLLGERASSEIIRKGSNKTIVEGFFSLHDNSPVFEILKLNELDFQDELILRREISLSGSNRCYINDTPVNLSVLREAGNMIIDLHGQHEHQSLLRTETHSQLLDSFDEIPFLLSDYGDAFKELSSKIQEYETLVSKEKQIKEKREYLEFKLNEINETDPRPDEDRMIEEELNILENSEKILSAATEMYDLLYENDNAVYGILNKTFGRLTELSAIDQKFSEKTEECSTAIAVVEDIARFLRSYKNKFDLDPSHLETLRTRLVQISALKKKYSGSLNNVLEKKIEFENELMIASDFTNILEKLQKEIDSLRENCAKKADILTSKRISISKKISGEIIDSLDALGIGGASFEIKLFEKPADDNEKHYIIRDSRKIKISYGGAENAEFYISTNKGEDLKPLSRIVSGGEVSRIMLALKKILARADRTPLLIFDEIDTGVSGRIAFMTGKELKSLSEIHQLIVITHLPQIAAMADTHFLVSKTQNGDRVTSVVSEIGIDERTEELAKMISGEKITSQSLEAAREMLEMG